MNRHLVLFFVLGTIQFNLYGQLQSPDEFLPHDLGEHFTPHHILVDYYEHVAAHSPLVKIVPYGKTNQDRPLMIAIVTTEANHARLEEIRQNNLRLSGMLDGEADLSIAKAIVWLGYSVHGNEAAGSESSMQVLYDLADPSNIKSKGWLDNTVVIMDPSINPDGYSRYTHWMRNVTMDENNPDIQDIEHHELWPGGRVNHYLFDLNRDWAWQTQVESQQRLALYHRWLPHIHADLHEMGHESSYFFAPAAKPYHRYITQWQRDFQEEIGRHHAKYFDEEGWLYFTKEVFDLFYPSYGDTYPTFSGAIGMTYEQGGGRAGGRAVTLDNGELLTLDDRIDHHKTTALSTIEITSVNADKVISEFKKFYDISKNKPPGKYKSFIIKKDDSGVRIRALADLLSNQGIIYGTIEEEKEVNGYRYHSFSKERVTVSSGDLVVNAYQPKGLLAQVLLEPSSELEDSVTYDITAWSLPYAYGLDAVALESKTSSIDMAWSEISLDIQEGYAYLVPHTDVLSIRYVSQLLAKDISVRVLTQQTTIEDRLYQPGTAVITRADNRSMGEDLYTIIKSTLAQYPTTVHSISGGFVDSGYDIGSSRNYLISRPEVLTIRGEGVGTYSHGQIKWYFDQVLDYPLSVVDINRLSRVDLNIYNTLILPEGWYSLSESVRGKISTWVNDGGKLIAIGSANRKLMDQQGFGIKRYATDEEKSEDQKANKAADLAARYNHYSESERRSMSDYVPGAIFQLEVDESHPLGFGLGEHYFSLRTSSITFPLIVGASNVIRHPKDDGQIIGFAGSKIKKRLNDTAAFVVESKGRGQVIYMADNPLYRGFWYNGLFLFSNALILVD